MGLMSSSLLLINLSTILFADFGPSPGNFEINLTNSSISFNDNLDKNFVKNLSTKLLEWTNQRWIITFSKNQGEMSIKDKEKNKQKDLIENTKKSNFYKTVLDHFPDAELIDVKPVRKDDD